MGDRKGGHAHEGTICEPGAVSADAADRQQDPATPAGRHRVKPWTWLVLFMGAAMAFYASGQPLLLYMVNFIRTFIHEFGHTVACWLFAHPAAPSFDIATGGGMTIYDDRNNLLLALIFLALLAALFYYRRNRATSYLILGGSAVYAGMLATSAHEVVILLAGHGAELLVAGVLLYRVLGDSRIAGKLRQPVYAFTGCFILLQVTTFSFQLLTDQAYRYHYEGMRGAGFEMDFTRVAHDFLGVDVGYVAFTCFVIALLVPPASYCCFRFEKYLLPARNRVRQRLGSPRHRRSV